MTNWRVYENTGEIVIAKNRRSKLIVVIPLNNDAMWYNMTTGAENNYYTRMKRLAQFIAKSLKKFK